MCLRRLPARSGAAALLAWAVAAALAPAASGAAGFHRDRTLLPKQLRGPSAPDAVHAAGTGGALARTIVGLAVVLAVVFGIYWLLKAYARGKSGAAKADGRMEVVATTPLAPNRALHLVRVGDGLILVGSSEGGVTRIRAYTAGESDDLQAQLDGASDPLRPFGAAPGTARRGVLDELRRRTARR